MFDYKKNRAISEFEAHKNKLDDARPTNFGTWRSELIVLMTKYLPEDANQYIKDFENFEFVNPYEDKGPEHFGIKLFTYIELTKNAKQYIKQSVEYIQKYGIKRTTLGQFIHDNGKLIVITFTVGFTFGVWIKPLFEKLLQFILNLF